jgi:hypothetical protein
VKRETRVNSRAAALLTAFLSILARIIHDSSSRNGGVARDTREEWDLRDV